MEFIRQQNLDKKSAAIRFGVYRRFSGKRFRSDQRSLSLGLEKRLMEWEIQIISFGYKFKSLGIHFGNKGETVDDQKIHRLAIRGNLPQSRMTASLEPKKG